MKKDIKKALSIIACICLLAGLVPALSISAAAVSPAIYVSSAGNDSTGNGSESSPYATLGKAVDTASDGGTVYVMTDLTVTSLARVTEKSITIRSAGTASPRTITRGSSFLTSNDTSRGYYNPAMLEVTVNSTTGTAALTLENIILDDKGLTNGTTYGQAVAGGSSNTDYVQDAIVAAYGNTKDSNVGITLGDGAILRNPGGMSAVRLTEKATLTMKGGSVIEDTLSGLSPSRFHAVWLQGANIEMQSGAAIQNMNINGIYAEGGNVTLDEGSLIQNITNPSGKNVCGILGKDIALSMGGEITGLRSGAQAINLTRSTAEITKTGYIHDNSVWYGSIYLLTGNTLNVYGRINSNTSSAHAGGIAMSNNAKDSSEYNFVNMYDGAEINGNTSAENGGGVLVSAGIFTMYGGTISGNKSLSGAGLYVRRGGKVIMNGGTISNNNATNSGGGVGFDQSWTTCLCEFNGGTITGNTAASGNDIAITGTTGTYISDYYLKMNAENFTLGDPDIYMVTDSKTVAASGDNEWFSLGNANKNSVTALTTAATNYSWTVLSTLWVNTPEATAHFSVSVPTSAKPSLPFYAIVIKTDANGDPLSDTAKCVACKLEKGRIDVLMSADGSNGYAVALVQPSADYGSVVIAGPESISYTGAASYQVPYTATYTMSQSFAEQVAGYETAINMNPSSLTFSFTVNLDSALTPEMSGSSYVYTWNSAIFNVDEAGITTTDGGHTLVVPCTLKSGWDKDESNNPLSNADLVARLTQPMVLTGKAILDGSNFDTAYARSDSSLSSTGSIMVTLPIAPNTIVVPANTCKTKLNKQGTLTLSKTVAGSGTPTASTEFTFTVAPASGTLSGTYSINGGAGQNIPSSGQLALKAGETATLTGLTAGSYTVTETAPSGTAATNYTGTTYTVGSGTATTGTAASVTISTGAATALAFTNSYYYSSGGGENFSGGTYSVTLTKADADSSNTYLSGAVFRLYMSNGTSVGTYTTDSDGKINVTGLANGSYYFVETAAPTGYGLDTTKHSFTISNASTALTVTNIKNSADTPSALNSTDHIKYVAGYRDGTVQPNVGAIIC